MRSENILFRKELPETGQSTVVVVQDRLFFTTLKPVTGDATLGKDIIAWCVDAKNGRTIWKREIAGKYPLRLSGCFSDSSGPPPVSDGKHVCFFNASGSIACFDLAGKELWKREIMAVGRSQPFRIGENVAFIRQRYMPNREGKFTHDHGDAPLEEWTQLHAINLKTGKDAWTTNCGVNMGCVPLLQKAPSGGSVIAVGRGGGHNPPESPEGVSLVSAENGSTLWTLALDGFMSTMTFNIYGKHLLVFHDAEHLWVNVETGKIDRRVSILEEVPACIRKENGTWQTASLTLPPPKNKRAIIQQSNLKVGKYHYFRSYTMPYVGRIDVENGQVEYLQLPVQLKSSPENREQDALLWDASQMPSDLVDRLIASARKPPKELPIHQWCFEPNDMRNSRGFEVMGDARSRGTGWGHHASQLPTAVGNKLYIPIMNGTVYVLDWTSGTFDNKAILGINDLGPVGESFNRASISFAQGHLFAHTLRELICIGEPEIADQIE